jgi:hypothetical protein
MLTSRPSRPSRLISTASLGLFKIVFEAIGELMTPPEPKRRPIGFVTPEDKQRD